VGGGGRLRGAGWLGCGGRPRRLTGWRMWMGCARCDRWSCAFSAGRRTGIRVGRGATGVGGLGRYVCGAWARLWGQRAFGFGRGLVRGDPGLVVKGGGAGGGGGGVGGGRQPGGDEGYRGGGGHVRGGPGVGVSVGPFWPGGAFSSGLSGGRGGDDHGAWEWSIASGRRLGHERGARTPDCDRRWPEGSARFPVRRR